MAQFRHSDRLPWIHIPAGALKLIHNPKVNWMFASEPGPGTVGRPIHWPLLHQRHTLHPRPRRRFRRLGQMGAHGWSDDEVLPYFRKPERYIRGKGDHRGTDGRLQVEDQSNIRPGGIAREEDLRSRSTIENGGRPPVRSASALVRPRYGNLGQPRRRRAIASAPKARPSRARLAGSGVVVGSPIVS